MLDEDRSACVGTLLREAIEEDEWSCSELANTKVVAETAEIVCELLSARVTDTSDTNIDVVVEDVQMVS